jgi:hypothetical protein
MRAVILLILLMAVQSHAAERTWTIARDVYQADGELIAVRGDLAYLKIDGNIEEIPIERLSALDQHYLSSLSLAPILPGPANAASNTESSVLPASSNSAEEMPLPGPPDPPRTDAPAPHEPELAPAFGGAPIRQPGTTQAPYRFDRYGRTIPPQIGPPQSGTPANYLAPQGNPQGNWGENFDPNDRRDRRAQQEQNERDSRAQRNVNDEDRGIFSFRARRQERERAAANRGR